MQSANRVILFDAGWNPCVDEQAIARVRTFDLEYAKLMSQAYRYGQKKDVYVYRLYGSDTIEDVLYLLNVRKMALAK